MPEYGWTTQKVFHLMNFIVNGGDDGFGFFFSFLLNVELLLMELICCFMC